jgi:glycosyltransferase involved in cell wall biosynthesis
MRVLIIHSRYRSGPASGENQVVDDEARLLQDGGHDVVVHSRTPEVRRATDLVRAGRDAVWSRDDANALRDLIRVHHPDIVHCHNVLTGMSPSIIRASRTEGVPVVMTLHNYRLMCLPGTFLRDGKVCEACLGHIPWRGVRYRCYRGSRPASIALGLSLSVHRMLSTFDSINLFLAVSRFLRDKHIEAGIPANRIQAKANFAWPVERSTGPGEYFLYIGRLAPEKGVASLLDAWKHLSGTRLIVAGDGPQAAELRERAPASVEFLGTVPHSEVRDLLKGARALMVPSLWYEGAPRSILEAYSAGVPVLASGIGALPEVVQDSISGRLVDPADPGAWVKAVRSMADDDFRQALSAGARQTYERFYRPEIALRTLEDVYKGVLAGRVAEAG